MKKLSHDFYVRDTITVARALLGTLLVHRVDGVERVGRIVETEAYPRPARSGRTVIEGHHQTHASHVRAAGRSLRLPHLRHASLHECRHRTGRARFGSADPRARTGRKSIGAYARPRPAVQGDGYRSQPGRARSDRATIFTLPKRRCTSPLSSRRGRVSVWTTRATGHTSCCAFTLKAMPSFRGARLDVGIQPDGGPRLQKSCVPAKELLTRILCPTQFLTYGFANGLDK